MGIVMRNSKVLSLKSDEITFDNGMKLFSVHDKECCESHYLSLSDLTIEDFVIHKTLFK